jgi:uncharacterized surface protein with fasciclin (FAS1) repeats
MSARIRTMGLTALVATTAMLSACKSSSTAPAAPGTLAQVAAANGNFTALVAAATKAGLVPTLNNNSQSLTVFAPTDAAFTAMAASLGFADANAMVAALDGPTLAKILQYHVLPAKKLAAALVAGGATQATLYAFNAATTSLALNTTSGVRITDALLTQATVTTADVAASNGVIHVIDKVLVPPGVLNLVQMAQLNPAFSTLVQSVVAANLAATLSGTGPFTVFAPTNDAFTAVFAELSLTPAQLLANTALLTKVLTYHVVAGLVPQAAVPLNTPITTVQGQTITVDAMLNTRDQNGRTCPIVATDVFASNGVIHVISKVFLPS